MELSNNRKRRRPVQDLSNPAICFDELNEDLLERVLSRLPPSSFLRCRTVCKRWCSVATSATFHLACSQLPFREPWFYMVGSELDQSLVFDTGEWRYRNLKNHLTFLGQFHASKPIPVASSGGLICFRTTTGDFIVSNPVTGQHRELPPTTGVRHPIHAIAMHLTTKGKNFFKLVVVSGDFPILDVAIYDSQTQQWEEGIRIQGPRMEESDAPFESNTVYFLSKAGEVVATDMQRSPSKQYSSFLTMEEEEDVIYFLSPSGQVVGCNLARRIFTEYPRLLPAYMEHSIDVVECNGEMVAVVLSELLESCSLRIWRFSKVDRLWRQVASMPPSLSHEFYGKGADINCVGHGESILICVSSSDFNGSFICNLGTNHWSQLPKCSVEGETKEFLSAFSFEPRVEACV